MAHREQGEFIAGLAQQFPAHFNDARVLEIGSLFINGTMRIYFKRCQYMGLDVADGPFVDVVCRGEDYDAASGSFDTVASAECFEHNPDWSATFGNMVRVCRSGGLVFFTCATTGREEHGTIWSHPGASPLTVAQGSDYYQNLTEGEFRGVCPVEETFSEYEFSVNDRVHDLYFWGIKK